MSNYHKIRYLWKGLQKMTGIPFLWLIIKFPLLMARWAELEYVGVCGIIDQGVRATVTLRQDTIATTQEKIYSSIELRIEYHCLPCLRGFPCHLGGCVVIKMALVDIEYETLTCSHWFRKHL